MLDSIRRFSSTIYAKILLGIVVIPFVFWGMGDVFSGGNKNIVVTIDKDKHSTQEFVNFIKMYQIADQKIDAAKIEEFLTAFIGDKLIEKEIEDFKIILSDISLSKLIMNQKDFKREGVFSRPEYEKFLIKNNVTAGFFESNLSRNEKKKQLLDIIGGGITPSLFLVNDAYNNVNRKFDIQLINLNKMFQNKLSITENEINDHYNNNKENFEIIYKSLKILELNPKKITESEDYSDIFSKDKSSSGPSEPCVGEDCCTGGMVFNKKIQRCQDVTENMVGSQLVKRSMGMANDNVSLKGGDSVVMPFSDSENYSVL